MKITQKALKKIISEADSNMWIDSYLDYVNSAGHASPASASTIAAFLISKGIESVGYMRILGDRFGVPLDDIVKDFNRQQEKKAPTSGLSQEVPHLTGGRKSSWQVRKEKERNINVQENRMKTTEKRVRAIMMEVLEEHIAEEMLRTEVRHMLEESGGRLDEFMGMGKLKDLMGKMTSGNLKDDIKQKAKDLVSSSGGKQKGLNIPPKHIKNLQTALAKLKELEEKMRKANAGLGGKGGKPNPIFADKYLSSADMRTVAKKLKPEADVAMDWVRAVIKSPTGIALMANHNKSESQAGGEAYKLFKLIKEKIVLIKKMNNAKGRDARYHILRGDPSFIDKIFEPPKGPLASLFGKKDKTPFKGF